MKNAISKMTTDEIKAKIKENNAKIKENNAKIREYKRGRELLDAVFSRPKKG